jgi:hypothetical protein
MGKSADESLKNTLDQVPDDASVVVLNLPIREQTNGKYALVADGESTLDLSYLKTWAEKRAAKGLKTRFVALGTQSGALHEYLMHVPGACSVSSVGKKDIELHNGSDTYGYGARMARALSTKGLIPEAEKAGFTTKTLSLLRAHDFSSQGDFLNAARSTSSAFTYVESVMKKNKNESREVQAWAELFFAPERKDDIGLLQIPSCDGAAVSPVIAEAFLDNIQEVLKFRMNRLPPSLQSLAKRYQDILAKDFKNDQKALLEDIRELNKLMEKKEERLRSGKVDKVINELELDKKIADMSTSVRLRVSMYWNIQSLFAKLKLASEFMEKATPAEQARFKALLECESQSLFPSG